VGAGSMHGTLGDVDGDGLVDLLVVDLEHSALYRNLGGGVFEDVTGVSGLNRLFGGKGGWAALLLDFDNDGHLDIFSANGAGEELILQPPLLLQNDGRGRFRDVGPLVGEYFRTRRSGRGAAIFDYDNDGALDIIVSHVDLQATAVLLRNDGGNENNWFGLKLVGNGGPASAVAAKVTLTAGGRTQVRINQPGTAYLSYNDPRLHFGLGAASRVDRLEIRWPDGRVDVHTNLPAGAYLTLVQGQPAR
jgi:enediyne biosynthesis protein E4